MQTLITFLVRGEEFAIDAGQVAGIRDISHLLADSRSSEDVLRAVGTAYPEYECYIMHTCLGMTMNYIQPNTQMITLDSADAPAGFIVDGIADLLAVEAKELRYLVYQRLPRRGIAEIRGVFFRDVYLQLIDIRQILTELRRPRDEPEYQPASMDR